MATQVATLAEGDHTDPATPGLQLRVRAKRNSFSRTWLLRYRWGRESVRIAIGHVPATSLAEARERAWELRKVIDNGIDPRKAGLTRVRRAVPPTVSLPAHGAAPNSIEALVEEFLTRFIAPHRKHPQEVRRILEKEVLATWRGRDARTVKPREVLELLDGIVDRGSPVMANRVASLLTQLFKYGVHRQRIESTPVQLLYAPGGQEKPRNRALSDAELAALLTHLDELMSRAPRTIATIRIILHTACRRSEIALARWSHFHLDDESPSWRIPPELSKTGVECITPLVPTAVMELKRLKRNAGRTPWVFPNEDAEDAADPKILTRSLNRHLPALAAKHIQPFTLHDLRRTVRTGLARLKVAPHIAERVLNHAQPGIIAAYDVHAYLDEKREALQQWAAHLSSLSR